MVEFTTELIKALQIDAEKAKNYSKEEAQKFLREIGILDENNNIAEPYRTSGFSKKE